MHASMQELLASRGAIYDRNFYPLATSLKTWDLYIDGSKFNQNTKTEEIALMCKIIKIECQDLINESIDKNIQILVKRKMPFSETKLIHQNNFHHIYTLDSFKRIYPEKNLAGQLIGYVGLDQNGLWGIESDFNSILEGQSGYIFSEQDPFGRQIKLGLEAIEEPIPGNDIILTIDKYIQNFAQDHLLTAINKYEAAGGSILVMNPKTGAILAMANYPEIELTNEIIFDDNLNQNSRNRIISDIYEPGSVMKLLTSAIALDLDLIDKDTTYFDKGYVDIGPQRIQNWDLNAYGETTVKNHLIHSLNTGAVWIAQKIGAERFYDYLNDFGFGTKTTLGLSGEAEGMLRTNKSKDWYPIDLATNSYGQGIAATPIQVLTAINALINNGKLMQPHIIKEVINQEKVKTIKPVELGQVIKMNTAKEIQQLMLAIVNENQYHQAQIDGFNVAGKTGTTINTINAIYDWDYTIASFIGYVPYESPEISILIKIDYPKGEKNLGGEIAAPTFSALATDILEYLEIAPSEEMVKKNAR
jgi:stage V sporulation protein D (sporulation-specific penicillin-binding protein)